MYLKRGLADKGLLGDLASQIWLKALLSINFRGPTIFLQNFSTYVHRITLLYSLNSRTVTISTNSMYLVPRNL